MERNGIVPSAARTVRLCGATAPAPELAVASANDGSARQQKKEPHNRKGDPTVMVESPLLSRLLSLVRRASREEAVQDEHDECATDGQEPGADIEELRQRAVQQQATQPSTEQCSHYAKYQRGNPATTLATRKHCLCDSSCDQAEEQKSKKTHPKLPSSEFGSCVAEFGNTDLWICAHNVVWSITLHRCSSAPPSLLRRVALSYMFARLGL